MLTRGVVVWAAAWPLVCAAPALAEDERDRAIERLERKVGELQKEIGEIKAERKRGAEAPTGSAAPPAAAPTATAGTAYGAPAEAERLQIGGYGSARFEGDSARGTHPTFTLRRFVLTADAKIAPRLRSYLELEFERFRKLELERTAVASNGGLQTKQAIEGTDNSELSLEQAWLQYDLAESLGFRVGAILVPLGRFNLNHDDNLWDLPRRSLVDRGVPVLPVAAAWDELGAGVNGSFAAGEKALVDYRLYVVNGAVISPEAESVVAAGGADGRTQEVASNFSTSTGTFANDFKDGKAVTGRLAFSPALGREVAGSFYHGRYTPDFLPSESITALAVDGLSVWGRFELEGEYVHSDFGDVPRIARAFARRVGPEPSGGETAITFNLEKLAETRRGYWVEARWRFRPEWLKRSIVGRPFEDPVLTAVMRGEQVWLGGLLTGIDASRDGAVVLRQVDRRVDRFTVGGSYRPVPLVAFQLAYELTKANRGGLGGVTNYIGSADDTSHAVLVGAAFGF